MASATSALGKIAGEPIARLLDNLKSPEDRVRYWTRIELGSRPTKDVIAAKPGAANSLTKASTCANCHKIYKTD